MRLIKIGSAAIAASFLGLATVLVYAVNVPTKPLPLLATPSWETTVVKAPGGPERWAAHNLDMVVQRN